MQWSENIQVFNSDCLEAMKEMESDSIEACVTDSPYGLSFMGKAWDYDVPKVEIWQEVFRILKPGGHLLSFAGTRTQHRMAVNIEDAGFEIRDMIAWIYGSGFPKSLNISKAIDKAAGVEFDSKPASGVGFMKSDNEDWNITKNQLTKKGESTPEAQQWDGWGTALKPALEPITVARKPVEGTVAQNVLKHGTGGLNIDGCKIESETLTTNIEGYGYQKDGERWEKSESEKIDHIGRWPANFILSYPENEYIMKDNLTKEQKNRFYEWAQKNT